MEKQQRDIDWLIKNYMPYFQGFQMTEEIIRSYYETWKQGKPVVLIGDYLWHIFHEILSSISNQSESEAHRYKLNNEAYSKMWEYLVKVENRNGNHVKRSMHDNELRLWQIESESSRWKSHIEIISGHCCPYCDNLDKKLISFEEALEKQYLASKNCTRQWGCNCCYAMIPVRDEDGRLILR